MDSELYGFLEKEREKTELAVIADYNDKTRERFALSLSE